MQALPHTPQPETTRAFTVILERLYAMARQTDPSLGNPSDLEAMLIALPFDKRSQVLLVLESVENRAQARADEELAEAARAVRRVAGRVWEPQGPTNLPSASPGMLIQEALPS
jgi:hypothetical protein